MEWVFSEADLEAQRTVREAFGPSDRFNPCKVLPGGHGCATGHASEVMRHLGAGAYI